MSEAFFLVTPGKQPPVIIKVEGSVIAEAPEPISQFRFKNFEWVQQKFREYGWECTPVEPLSL